MNCRTSLKTAAALLAIVFLPAGIEAQQAPAKPGMATITVTVVGKKNEPPPALSNSDIQLNMGKENKQVAGWNKAEKLYLAILIDEALSQDIAGNWSDLKAFMDSQPPTTSIAVAYARESVAMVAQDFTTDRAAVDKALRIPLGPNMGSSPYLSVIDWLKRWPSTGDRREMLVISSGFDFLRRGMGPLYPDVDTAVDLAQKGNVNIWTLYYPGFGHMGTSMFRANNGQLNLSKLSEETGAESFNQGFGQPVSLKPYLDEFASHLANQYLLSFAGDGGKKGKLISINVRTEVQGAEFLHAPMAFLTGSQ